MNPVRFLYTSQPGKGFTELVSPDLQLKNWIRENLRQPHSPSYTRTLNKGLSVTLQDGWVICTYLTRQTDDNNRPFIRNHSILVPEAEFNQLARNFDQDILAHIEEGDERALEGGLLMPLEHPKATGNGLEREDMETASNYFGSDLERLFASLISGKPFSVRIRGTTEEAIDLATILLKTAALADLPIPHLSTFEPGPKTRNWYPSQVSSSPQARVAVQLHQKTLPEPGAVDAARRLVQSFVNLDQDGLASTMRTAGNHAEAVSQYLAATGKSAAAAAAAKGAIESAPGNEVHIYHFNKEYEATLNSRKEELDLQQKSFDEQKVVLLARENDYKQRLEQELEERSRALDRQEQELTARERYVEQREEDVRAEEAQVKLKGARREQWRHIEEICSVLHSNDCRELEDRVLSRFFDQLKNVERDNLQALKDGVRDFLPGLKKIAELNESERTIFLKDLEDIEKKLEARGSRWPF